MEVSKTKNFKCVASNLQDRLLNYDFFASEIKFNFQGRKSIGSWPGMFMTV